VFLGCSSSLEHAGQADLPTISPFLFEGLENSEYLSEFFSESFSLNFIQRKNLEKTLNFFLENLFLWWFSTIF
jgi:hypothetical protein